MTSSHRARVRAPHLTGRRWLNTGGRELSLADFRGRVLLLDFWTFCCVNCLHVLDELRPLEERFGDVLVTVGVHSPKFAHEADPDALAAAVVRYGVGHPVLDDFRLRTWDAYAAKAWPTLVVVDPEGYVVAQLSGEGHAAGLAVLVEELVAEHRAKGTLLADGGSLTVLPPASGTSLSFPGKVLRLPSGNLLVSDTAHHQLVELEPDLETEVRRIGSGARGFGPGTFSEPQGLALLPPDVAARVGYDVVVADTVNHALRGLRLADGSVRTLAGTGAQLRSRVAPGGPPLPALEQDLSSPWDVAWWRGTVLVAMAGNHQLWTFDPLAGQVAVLSGTTNEGLIDGPAEHAWYAQPSGLAVDVAGGRAGGSEGVWVADSETSSLRRLDGDPVVATSPVGQGLFTFGFRDGPGAEALLQHPLGVAALPDGSVAVADTYNGAVRRYDPVADEVTTLAQDLAEPSDLLLEPDGEHLVVVESAAHRLVRLPVPAAARRVAGEAQRVERKPVDLAVGDVRLVVRFTPPTGQKLDDRWGDPTRLTVSATPAAALLKGDGAAGGLTRDLVLDGGFDAVVLHVSVQAAACDGDPATGEVPQYAACHLYQQDWGIPVRPVPGAPAELALDLRGVAGR